MAGITIQLDEKSKSEIEHFSWVNWSELAREEVLKKEIFERYIKNGRLSKEDQDFCDKIDWHPVDELPLKESFIRDLEQSKKEPSGKSMTAGDFNKWCEEL